MYKLREIERRDLSKINEWRNDVDLIKFLAAPFRFINSEVDSNWFDRYMSNRGSAVRCAIVDEKDEILGMISLMDIDYLNQSAELHIMIGNKENQGKGIGTFAVKEMVNHAFYNINLQRIQLTVLEENIRAQRLYEKCGFICEGVLRDAVYKNGKFDNMRLYSILKKEFE